MGIAGGRIKMSASVGVKVTYPPQGVESADPLPDARFELLAPDAPAALLYGTGSGRFSLATVSDRTIPAGSSVTWDLYTGTDLRGPAGEACPFRVVRVVKIGIVSGGDSSGVRVGGASSNEWVGYFAAAGDKHDIFPGGPPYWAGKPAGKPVGSSTKNLKVENLGAVAVTVRVVVAGHPVASGYLMGILGLTYP